MISWRELSLKKTEKSIEFTFSGVHFITLQVSFEDSKDSSFNMQILLYLLKMLYLCIMILNKETAKQAARFLLQIKAIKLNNENPFTWASGRKSPIYCDNRVTLSYPEIRTFICEQFVSIVKELYADVDVIAGVATGGIPQGVLVAQALGKTFVYVRPEEKKHGLGNKIEGDLKSGQTVVVIEDLVSTGKSSLLAVDALRDAGCIVKGMAAIFTYNLEVAKQAFENKQMPLNTITDYHNLIELAAEESFIAKEDLSSLTKWRENPEQWSEERMK